MKWAYRLVFDTGRSVTVVAESRAEAIETYYEETGESREWVKEHCRIINCGRADK